MPPRVNAGDVLNIGALKKKATISLLNLFSSHLLFALRPPPSISCKAFVRSGRGEKRTKTKLAWKESFHPNSALYQHTADSYQYIDASFVSVVFLFYPNISSWNFPCSFCSLHSRTTQLSLWMVPSRAPVLCDDSRLNTLWWGADRGASLVVLLPMFLSIKKKHLQHLINLFTSFSRMLLCFQAKKQKSFICRIREILSGWVGYNGTMTHSGAMEMGPSGF